MKQTNFLYLINQELPQIAYNGEQYDEFGNVQPMYTDNGASAYIFAQLYTTMYNIFGQIYANGGYTANWEYALNGTNNLFSNLPAARQLLALLRQAWVQTALNVFDMELFLTKYIFFRTGISTLVYIDDQTVNFVGYWILGSSSLGVNTILAPNLSANPNCNIIIFNDTFTINVQAEIEALIYRYMRADATVSIQFVAAADIPAYGLVEVPEHYTYQFDARLIYSKALQYTNGIYPFDLIGYTKP